MRWIVGVLFMVLVSPAFAAEEEVTEAPLPTTAYDRMTLKFNATIKKFPTWEAFKSAVAPLIPPGSPGTCYALTGKGMDPVEVTAVTFRWAESTTVKKTAGGGWQLRTPDNGFIEYRLNSKERLLLRTEGVRSLFFFVATQRICAFPLQQP
jgi:hypothetical protein